jgi:hypothetical protein
LGAIVIVWMWWMELWLGWLTILDEVAAPPPPPDRHNVVDLADWRRSHTPDKPNGRAA